MKPVAPASIKTAPNAPKARAQVITVPAIIPFLDKGKVTLKKACIGVQPSVLAIESKRGLIDNMVDFKTLIVKE